MLHVMPVLNPIPVQAPISRSNSEEEAPSSCSSAKPIRVCSQTGFPLQYQLPNCPGPCSPHLPDKRGPQRQKAFSRNLNVSLYPQWSEHHPAICVIYLFRPLTFVTNIFFAIW